MTTGKLAAEPYQRDLVFTDDDFAYIRRVIQDYAGISLADHKRELVYGRLARRLRVLGMTSFAQYCTVLESEDGELRELVNALTTNLTAFFRESYHFDHLRETVLPGLLHGHARERRVRVWSAGCSTGEEPYSIAMVMREALPAEGWDVKILATDIDTNVIDRARAGVYPASRAEEIPDAYRRRFLSRGAGPNAGRVRVRDNVRAMITFLPLNLMHEWPMKGPFDVIFCRNVVIYFDKPTQRRLFARYADILAPGGYLYVGHSETLFKVSDRFEPVGRTVYRKT